MRNMEIKRQEEDKQGYTSTVKFECKNEFSKAFIELTGPSFKDAE